MSKSICIIGRPKALDTVDAYYWYQGSFIDSVAYNHMPNEWKIEQQQREKTMIRDKRNQNGVFLVTASANDAQIVEQIIAWRDYALALEKENESLQQKIKYQGQFG